MPTIKEDEFTDAGTVKPETAEKRIIAMIKERKWEADTEHELLLAFRRLDQLAHNGEEFGYIESAKMSTYLTTQGFAPFRSEENSSFLSYANDDTGSKMLEHSFLSFSSSYFLNNSLTSNLYISISHIIYLLLLFPEFLRFYHDYIGKLIPYLEDKDYLFPSKS
mmetsp:Transcript_15714/g.20391  ORF Transcript_15714/g.20391 Transcript_15714/m.20391 type:complete len:164 (+) Transcript_15714:368-859(+)